MKTISEYLNDLKEITGSDYKSAIALNVDRAVLSNMRKRNALSDDNAVKLAELLNVDKAELLLAATIARSSGEVKKAWEKISKLSGIAAGITLSFKGLQLAYAKSLILCILCKIIGWSKRPFLVESLTHETKCPCYKTGHSPKVNLGVLLRQVKTPPAGNFPFISLHSCVSPI